MFIEEFVTEVIAAEVAGNKPDISQYSEPRAGEEVVGTVSSPALLALIAVFDSRLKVVRERWPEMPKGPTEIKAALLAGEDLKIVDDTMWHELRRSFLLGVVDSPSIGLRKNGDELVVVKSAPPPQIKTIMISLADLLGDLDLGGECDNPNCRIHHPEAATVAN